MLDLYYVWSVDKLRRARCLRVVLTDASTGRSRTTSELRQSARA